MTSNAVSGGHPPEKKDSSGPSEASAGLPEPFPEKSQKTDIVLIFSVILLIFIGVGMVMSAAIATNQPFRLFNRQMISAILAVTVMLVTSMIDYHFWSRHRFFVYMSGLFLLILLYVPHVGMVMNGARRWIHLPGLTLQPSEIARDAMIFLAAVLLDKAYRKKKESGTESGPLDLPVKSLLIFSVPLSVYCALMLKEPDFGSTAFMVMILGTMFFLAGLSWRRLFQILGVTVPSALLFVFFHRYALERFHNFTLAHHSASSATTQLGQSLVALGAGGLAGLGLGHDWVGGGILPEPGTDFIFALVGEEFGLIGTFLILFFFLLIFFRGMSIAGKAPDFLGRILAQGFTLSIGVEAIFNMGVVTGLFPTKGIPLPFLSFGGSSLLSNAIGVGIILSVSRFSRKEPSRMTSLFPDGVESTAKVLARGQ